jgi:hypothetical protein
MNERRSQLQLPPTQRRRESMTSEKPTQAAEAARLAEEAKAYVNDLANWREDDSEASHEAAWQSAVMTIDRLRDLASRAEPHCLTCSDHGSVGLADRAEPCPDCTPPGSLGEAQKAVAYRPKIAASPDMDFRAGLPSANTLAYWKMRGIELEYAYTHPSAGAGVPQEVVAWQWRIKGSSGEWKSCTEADAMRRKGWPFVEVRSISHPSFCKWFEAALQGMDSDRIEVLRSAMALVCEVQFSRGWLARSDVAAKQAADAQSLRLREQEQPKG